MNEPRIIQGKVFTGPAKIGYSRISTNGSKNDGESLEAQSAILYRAGAELVLAERHTAMVDERPVFQEILSFLQPGDTFLVTRVDRFNRSTWRGAKLVDELMQKGINVFVGQFGMCENTAVGRANFRNILNWAELDRDMTVERLADGKARARLKPGYREGRKPASVPSSVLKVYAEKIEAGSCTVVQAARELDLSRPTVYKLLKSVS